ncbi:MAG: hypothetical protein H0T89_14255 [Deltaproteobacteria bacterium]|nr:hypothetical protein [Deltaproteobacteria bacterium]MDQ3300145.1 hypothetical protein [Myxococcota bacterium]
MKRTLFLIAVAIIPALGLGVTLGGCPKKNDKARDPGSKHDAGKLAVATDAAGPAEPLMLTPALPVPPIPAGLPALPENPSITPEAVALGELLFFDTRLSTANTMACATCHDPAAGFAGGTRQDTASGKPNLRRAPALVNLAWHKALGWDGRYASLAEHLAAHARGQLGDDLASAVSRIGDLAGYRAHFARIGGEPSGDLAMTALAAYVSTRYAGGSPWDRLERSPDVPADVRAGYQVFSGKAQCSVCHTPPLYTDLQYHRLGLIATADEGRGRVEPAQKGAFKTPTLRGATARTGFFHDASATSLDAAIDWHLAGGTGQGADPSIVDPVLKKIVLTPKERADLGAFVRALSDPSSPPVVKPALP